MTEIPCRQSRILAPAEGVLDMWSEKM